MCPINKIIKQIIFRIVTKLSKDRQEHNTRQQADGNIEGENMVGSAPIGNYQIFNIQEERKKPKQKKN